MYGELARDDTPRAAVIKRVLGDATTANRPLAPSRARAVFPGFNTSRPKIGTSATRKKVTRRATRDVRRARDASCDRAAPGARSTAALARAVSARLSCISPALRKPSPGTFSRRLPRRRAVRKQKKTQKFLRLKSRIARRVMRFPSAPFPKELGGATCCHKNARYSPGPLHRLSRPCHRLSR